MFLAPSSSLPGTPCKLICLRWTNNLFLLSAGPLCIVGPQVQWEGAQLWEEGPRHQEESQRARGGEGVALQTGESIHCHSGTLTNPNWP